MIIGVSYGLAWERLGFQRQDGKIWVFGLAILGLRCMIFTSINTFRFGGSNDLGLSFLFYTVRPGGWGRGGGGGGS